MRDISLVLNEIKKHLGMKTDTQLAEFLGTTQSNVATWRKRNTINYELIIAKCPNIDANYLLSGEGELLKEYYRTPKEEITQYNDDFGHMIQERIQSYQTTKSEFLLKTDRIFRHNQTIPLYDISATAGLVTLFKADKQTPIDYFSIPNLPKVDGALIVTGDSMYPLLKSGDVVFYKEINNIMENIFFGEMYLLDINNDEDEYTTVKYIQTSDRGPDWIRLVSYNQHHSPKDVHLSTVRAAAFIKGSLRVNSMR